MFRIIIDTQIFWRGLTADPSLLNAKFFDKWLEGNFKSVVSEEIVNEIITLPSKYPKMALKLKIDNEIIALASYFLQHKAEWVKVDITLPLEVCRDPKDIMFLACAIVGNADFIVSADNDLLDLKEFRGIKIVTVPQIMELLDI